MTGSATPRSVTALAALLLGVTGCTICPDPFDYSGPVPDGSAPQNDFRLRANGIIPVGAHAVPWPPIVRSAPAAPDDSSVAAVVAESAEESADASAAEPDDGSAGAAAGAAAGSGPANATQPVVMPTAAEAVEDLAGPPAPEPPGAIDAAVEEILPPATPAAPPVAPRLRETPGWKPRG